MAILFFKPIPKPAIWGKTMVKDYFGYHDFPMGIGQSWSFSGQDNDSNLCLTAPFEGRTLRELWQNQPELFGFPEGEFPVIISLVGPEDDLSIQVHPPQAYAKKLGYAAGKNEAWYFIEAEDNANIVYGHCAKDKNELQNYIDEERWTDLIRYLDVHPGDFVYLPAGLLHALRKGSLVYEIQQATDITYRFYDYHRQDAQGQERELHLQEAIECLSYNPQDMINDIQPRIRHYPQYTETVFISNESFTVTKLEIEGSCHFQDSHYQLATVVKGYGLVDQVKVKVGDNFLIPCNMPIECDGCMTIMMTRQ